MVPAQDTRYALFDEPLNNLDIRRAVRMAEQLRSAADGLNKTVVPVVHDIDIAAGYSGRANALRDGAIVANGSPAELMDPTSSPGSSTPRSRCTKSTAARRPSTTADT